MDLGSAIKKLRMDRKIAQEEVARYLDISYQAVSKWEAGRYLDAVFSLAFLYTKLGRKAEAIEAWQLHHRYAGIRPQ